MHRAFESGFKKRVAFQFRDKACFRNEFFQGVCDRCRGPAAIAEKLSQTLGNKIELVIKENKSLIAGFRLKIGDDVYEDSIASRISRLKKSLT